MCHQPIKPCQLTKGQWEFNKLKKGLICETKITILYPVVLLCGTRARFHLDLVSSLLSRVRVCDCQSAEEFYVANADK